MRHNLASPGANSRPVAVIDFDSALQVFNVATIRESLVAFNLAQATGQAERAGYRVRLTPAAMLQASR